MSTEPTAIDMMLQALREAKAAQEAADRCSARLAVMLRGRLRHCWASDLAALKRELRDFNIHTKEWKS